MTKTKKHKVVIDWEHGDADRTTTEIYLIDNLQRFLSFVYDIRVWNSNQGWDNLGHFCDGYHEHTAEFMKPIHEKYNNDYIDIVPEDCYSSGSGHRPTLEKIYIKDGNSKIRVVWEDCLLENTFTPYEIGSVHEFSSGNVTGIHNREFGNKASEHIYFNDFEKMGLGCKRGKYGKFNAKVVKCKVRTTKYDLEGMYEVKAFQHIYLCEYKGKYFIISKYGHSEYSEKLKQNKKYYFHRNLS